MNEPTYIHPLRGEFEFIAIGRAKACFKAQLTGEDSLFRAIQPHLMSRDLSYQYDAEALIGSVYAGGRFVGSFKRVSA